MASLKDKFIEGCEANGVPAPTAEPLWDENERSADYSLQQGPRRLLRADRLPHRLPEGQLPGRVHGGADLVGHGHQGQGAVLRRPSAPTWASRCCRRTSTRRSATSRCVEGKIRFGLAAVKGVGEGAVRAIVEARGDDGPFDSVWDFCERVDMQQVNRARAREPGRAPARSTPPARRAGHRSRCLEQAISSGRKSQADALAGQGSIFDLDAGLRPAGDDVVPRPSAEHRVRQARAAAAREGDARPVRLEPSAGRRPRPAARARSTAAPRARRPPRGRAS